MFYNIKLKSLILNILIPLGVGGFSAIITKGSMTIYKNMSLPVFAPPSQLFPIIWTILFIIMGISSYIIYVSKSPNKRLALIIYSFQLFFNFIWPIIFFNLKMYTLAFIWLLLLLIIIITIIIKFYKISKIAAYIQIPYLLWCVFASILNFYILIKN